MAEVEEKLKSVKAEIKSIIVSCPFGLTFQQFLKDYKECVGISLPFKYFGCNSAIEFLRSMPDVLRINETPNGSVLVPIGTELMSHIDKLVSCQRSNRKSSSKPKRMTKYKSQKYYQVVTKKKLAGGFSEVESVDSFALDDVDNLDIVWTSDVPDNKSDPLMFTETDKICKRPVASNFEDKLSILSDSRDNCSISSVNIYDKTKDDPLSLYSSPPSSTKEAESVNLNSSILSDLYNISQSSFNYDQLNNESIISNVIDERPKNETNLDDFSKKTLSKNNNVSQKTLNSSSLNNDIESKWGKFAVTEEHERFLNGLLRGIVLNEEKLIEPYNKMKRETSYVEINSSNGTPSKSILNSVNYQQTSPIKDDNSKKNVKLTLSERFTLINRNRFSEDNKSKLLPYVSSTEDDEPLSNDSSIDERYSTSLSSSDNEFQIKNERCLKSKKTELDINQNSSFLPERSFNFGRGIALKKLMDYYKVKRGRLSDYGFGRGHS